eukprot:2987787-Amphidinium_carterae.2
MVRRLYLQCYSRALKELELTNTSGKLPLRENEKAARLAAFQFSKPNIQISGEWELSVTLIDEVNTSVKRLCLPYLAWSACTSRGEELAHKPRTHLARETLELRSSPAGTLLAKASDRHNITDLSSDFRVWLAFHCRGTALHLGAALDVESHRNEWILSELAVHT